MSKLTKSGRLKLALVIIVNICVCLNSVALILHSTNDLFNKQAYSSCDLNTSNYFSAKSAAAPSTAMIAFAMLGIGDGLCLILAIILLVWMNGKRKKQEKRLQNAKTMRIVCYLFASLALISTAVPFGYYLSYYLDSLKCSASIPNLFLAVWILTGVSTLLLIALTLICIVLPKVPDEKYLVLEDKGSEVKDQKKKNKQQVVDDLIEVKPGDGKPLNVQTDDQLTKKPKVLKYWREEELQNPVIKQLSPPNKKFQQRKSQIIKEFKQQRLKGYNVPRTSSPFNKLQGLSDEQQPPLQDFLNKHKTPVSSQRQSLVRQNADQIKDDSPPNSPSFQTPSKQQKLQPQPSQSPSVVNQISPTKTLHSKYMQSPSHPSVIAAAPAPGMIRSRKRIFDRISEYNKQTYLRSELKNKYGME